MSLKLTRPFQGWSKHCDCVYIVSGWSFFGSNRKTTRNWTSIQTVFIYIYIEDSYNIKISGHISQRSVCHRNYNLLYK